MMGTADRFGIGVKLGVGPFLLWLCTGPCSASILAHGDARVQRHYVRLTYVPQNISPHKTPNPAGARSQKAHMKRKDIDEREETVSTLDKVVGRAFT